MIARRGLPREGRRPILVAVHHAVARQRGLTFVEVLVVVAVMAGIVLISAPPLIEGLRNSRLRAATRQVLDDVRLARSSAVATGWQHRVVGTGDRYRTMAREDPSTPWPALSTAPIVGASLTVSEWVDVEHDFPGVTINPGDGSTFELVFGATGVPVTKSLNFTPLRLRHETGRLSRVSISTLGDARVD